MAVVALLRHFGCPLCWELAANLKEAKPRLESAGVKLIAIAVGTPEKARLLPERLPFPMDSLYADPECKGGMFVFKGQQLLYSHKDKATGDHAPMDDIFDICCKVPTN